MLRTIMDAYISLRRIELHRCWIRVIADVRFTSMCHSGDKKRHGIRPPFPFLTPRRTVSQSSISIAAPEYEGAKLTFRDSWSECGGFCLRNARLHAQALDMKTHLLSTLYSLRGVALHGGRPIHAGEGFQILSQKPCFLVFTT